MIEVGFLFLLYVILEVCNRFSPSYFNIEGLLIKLTFHVAE